MRFYISLAAMLSVLAVGVPSANAGIIMMDNFDSYVTGGGGPDQAAFVSNWPVFVAPGGTLTQDVSSSTPNSVNYATTAQRNQRTFAETGVPGSIFNLIKFSFDFYDSDGAASPYRQYANLQDAPASASGQLVSMGLNNNLLASADGGNYYMARILGADGGTGVSAYFKLNDAGAPLRSTGWHNLKVIISDTAFQFYVDNIPAQTIANTLTLRSYDHVRLGSGLSSTRSANFDNVMVATIPEPATFVLAGLSLVGLIGAARRRRQN